MLHDRTLLNHGSRYILMQLCSFNKAVSCALSKVEKPRMALKNKQLMSIPHVYGKDVFVLLPTGTYVYLLFVFVPHIHFGKAEVAYHHHGLVSYSSVQCSYTLES